MQLKKKKLPLWMMLCCTVTALLISTIGITYGIEAIQSGEIPYKARLRPVQIVHETGAPVFFWTLICLYLGFGTFASIILVFAWRDWLRTNDTINVPGDTAWAEGELVSDDGDVIAFPGMSIEQNTATVVEDRLHKARRYRKAVGGPVPLRGKQWRFVAYFEDKLLNRLTLVLDDRREANLADVWAEEAFLQAMVRGETGRRRLPAKFPWGSVGAAYDQKGGFSAIWFRYEPARKKSR